VLLFEETEFVGFFSREATDYFLEAFFYASSFAIIFVPRCRRLSHRRSNGDLESRMQRQVASTCGDRRRHRICDVAVEPITTDRAIELLSDLVKTPNGPTPGTLSVEPEWDPVRSDPRFQELVKS